MSLWHNTITNQGDHLEEIGRTVLAQQDTIDALAEEGRLGRQAIRVSRYGATITPTF